LWRFGEKSFCYWHQKNQNQGQDFFSNHNKFEFQDGLLYHDGFLYHYKEFANQQLILSYNYHMWLLEGLVALDKLHKIIITKDNI